MARAGQWLRFSTGKRSWSFASISVSSAWPTERGRRTAGRLKRPYSLQQLRQVAETGSGAGREGVQRFLVAGAVKTRDSSLDKLGRNNSMFQHATRQTKQADWSF